MKRAVLYILLTALLLAGCGAPPDPDEAQESIQVIAMDTAMLITTYGERSPAAAYACEDTIRDLEDKLSRTREDSEVSRLNAAGGDAVEVSEDLRTLLYLAHSYHFYTEGAIDITIAPVVSAWGFAGDSFQVPSPAELEKQLKLVDGATVSVGYREDGQPMASLEPGQSIDLGGVAKGYAADKIVDVLREHEVPRANINLGGNVLAYGDRPDGTPWRVGIQDPARVDEQNAFAGVLALTDSFAVTSGGYQRYFEQDGKTYHHIIDPATGYPADSGLTSVTVVAPADPQALYNGTMCDAFSTALFIMGEEKALDFWRFWKSTENPFELVLITEDNRVVVTEGLADRFTLDEASGYRYEIVS